VVDLFQPESGQSGLLSQSRGHFIFGHVAEIHQDLADPLIPALLEPESLLHLVAADQPGFDQEVSQALARPLRPFAALPCL